MFHGITVTFQTPNNRKVSHATSNSVLRKKNYVIGENNHQVRESKYYNSICSSHQRLVRPIKGWGPNIALYGD